MQTQFLATDPFLPFPVLIVLASQVALFLLLQPNAIFRRLLQPWLLPPSVRWISILIEVTRFLIRPETACLDATTRQSVTSNPFSPLPNAVFSPSLPWPVAMHRSHPIPLIQHSSIPGLVLQLPLETTDNCGQGGGSAGWGGVRQLEWKRVVEGCVE